MAYTFVDNISAATVASASTIAVSRTLAVGDNLVVLLHYDGGTGTATVADTLGNTYTQIDSLDDTLGSFVSLRLYFCNVITGGPTTITATMNAARTNSILGTWKYQGLSGTPVVTIGTEQSPAPTTTDGVKPANGTPSTQPAMVFGVSVNYTGTTGATLLAGTGMTDRGNIANGDTTIGTVSRSADKRVTALTATSATFTNNTATQQINTMGLIWQETAVAAGASYAVPGMFGPGVSPSLMGQFAIPPLATTIPPVAPVIIGSTFAAFQPPGPSLSAPFSSSQFVAPPLSNFIAPPPPLNPVVGSLGYIPKPGPGIGPSPFATFAMGQPGAISPVIGVPNQGNTGRRRFGLRHISR